MSHCHTTADITADTEPGDCSEASAAVLQYICQVSPFMIRDSGCCQLSVLSPGNTHHHQLTFGEDGGPQLAGGGAVQQVVLPGQTRLLPAPGRSQGGGGGGLLVIGAHGGVSCTMAGSQYKATPWLGHITVAMLDTAQLVAGDFSVLQTADSSHYQAAVCCVIVIKQTHISHTPHTARRPESGTMVKCLSLNV